MRGKFMMESKNQREKDQHEYFTKKEILERLKWAIFAIISINFYITIGLIQALVYYNGITLLAFFLGLILGGVGYKVYKNYKRKHY